jgi:two-component SAPR family response regulator
MTNPYVDAQGLSFYGNTFSGDQEPSYMVFNNNHIPSFSNHIDITFDLKMALNRTFGYILHLVNNKTGEAYSLTCGYVDDYNSIFKFNTEGKRNHLSITLANTYIEQWLPAKLSINFQTGENYLIIGKYIKKGDKITNLPSRIPFFISFGRREQLIDVSPFAIRNLKISDGKSSYIFPLNESQGEKVHDINGKVVGSVSHPYWLMRESYYWKKRASFITPVSIGSKFNVKRQEIEFVTPNYLLIYAANTKKFTKKKYANQIPVHMNLGTICLNEKKDKLYDYEINNLPIGTTTIGALNLNTLKWEATGKAYTPTQLHHHVGFWDNTKTKYIVHGGFGSERYSDQFRVYNKKTDKWDILAFKGDKITYRFYSSIASTKDGNYIYLYGGVGNDSGDQCIGHDYYNDLYRIDLRYHTIKKCWDIPLKEKRVPSETMILSKDGAYLYVIRYAEYIKSPYLKLYKIAIKDGNMEQVGDSIPFASGSIKSTVALYDNPKLNELYCITHEFNEKANQVKTNIFTISTPPVNKSEIENVSYEDNGSVIFIILVIIVLCSAIVIFVHLKRKKKNTIGTVNKGKTPIQTGIPNESVTSNPDISVDSSKIKGNKIFIYGRFTMINRDGRDITYMFGKKLKLIFIYILLNSLEKKDGVNSLLLNELFWPDKTEEKAKNIKGVSLSNLRKILSELDGIKLTYDKGIFRIEFEPDICYCDYFYLRTQLKEQPQLLKSYFSVWERGDFLVDIENPLFDKFKEESEELIFSILPNKIPIYYNNKRFRDVIRICYIILNRDPLNEQALYYCIFSYKKLNEFENVLKVYSKFIIEYRKSMGKDYTKTIESILKEIK